MFQVTIVPTASVDGAEVETQTNHMTAQEFQSVFKNKPSVIKLAKALMNDEEFSAQSAHYVLHVKNIGMSA